MHRNTPLQKELIERVSLCDFHGKGQVSPLCLRPERMSLDVREMRYMKIEPSPLH